MRCAIRIPRIRILKFNAEESLAESARLHLGDTYTRTIHSRRRRLGLGLGLGLEALRNHNVSLESVPR